MFHIFSFLKSVYGHKSAVTLKVFMVGRVFQKHIFQKCVAVLRAQIFWHNSPISNANNDDVSLNQISGLKWSQNIFQ